MLQGGAGQFQVSTFTLRVHFKCIHFFACELHFKSFHYTLNLLYLLSSFAAPRVRDKSKNKT
jgi:hypothetical protein